MEGDFNGSCSTNFYVEAPLAPIIHHDKRLYYPEFPAEPPSE